MWNYIPNTLRCRKDVLFEKMENNKHIEMDCKHMCCDICAESCVCPDCIVLTELKKYFS